MPKSKRLPLIYGVTLSLIPLAYLLLLARGNGDWGGTTPPDKLLSTTSIEGQTPDFCAPLIRTPRATWLLTSQKDDNAMPTWKVDPSTLALNTLLPPVKEKAKADYDSQMAQYMPKSSNWTTLISKLDAEGVFQPVAIVPDMTCLSATPDGATVYALTGLDIPQGLTIGDSNPKTLQTAVFRTDDQGAHWTWLKNGFFPNAARWGENLRPSFYNSREVWAWTEFDDLTLPGKILSEGGSPLQSALRLFYSADGGASVQQVKASAPIAMSRNEAVEQFPADAEADSSGANDKTTGFVVQLSDDRAIAWLSQSFYYGIAGDHFAKLNAVLDQMELRREGQTWVMGPPKRTAGANLKSVTRTPAGQIYGVMARSRANDIVARFDQASRAWIPLASTPNSFSPLPAEITVDDLWASDKHLVISLSSIYFVPRLLYPFGYDNATIHGGADYYSDDGGRHWTHLKVRAGILALDPHTDELLASPFENWESTAPIRAYQLGK